MSFSTILNILIGLIFTWAILSLAAMNIQEWLSNRKQWRANMLHATIGKMLTDLVLVDQFYNHPLIRSLFSDENGKRRPSYITNSQFSQAMIDLLSATGTEASLLQQQLYKLYSICGRFSRKQKKDAQARIAVLLGMTRKAIVSETGEDSVSEILGNINLELGQLEKDYPKLKDPIENALYDVRDQKVLINTALAKIAYAPEASDNIAVNKIRAGVIALSITHPQLKQAMYAILNSVPQTIWQKENELELIRHSIEAWFESNMERLTGWYKRRAQISLFSITVVLALLGNVDSINLTHRLWDEPALRESVLNNIGQVFTNMGTKTDASTTEQLLSLQQDLTSVNLPIGWTGATLTLPEIQELSATGCTLSPRTATDLYGIWVSERCYEVINAPLPTNAAGWIMKLVGILMTALATSQGASFWFDLLKKIMNVRLSGYNPKETETSLG
jgi:hypothetical protein